MVRLRPNHSGSKSSSGTPDSPALSPRSAKKKEKADKAEKESRALTAAKSEEEEESEKNPESEEGAEAEEGQEGEEVEGGEASHKSLAHKATGFTEGELSEDASRAQVIGHRMLKSPVFEQGIGLVIAINFVCVIVETDSNAAEEDLPAWIWYASWGLLTTFVVELILKLFVLRRLFWHEGWNVFDFLVICVDLVMSVLDSLNMSFINVSMLRVLRLSRLARATKVLRVFPELRLMLAGLAGAMQAIFWGTVLLFVALLVWSVLAVQFIHPLNQKVTEMGQYDPGCVRCERAYASTFQAALTFTTQIVAGDSWGRETVPIVENYPPTALFFLGVFVSVGLAILNLILGVVVNVATEARDGLLKEMADEKLLQRMESHNQLLKMCHEMDEDGNDELTFEELRNGFDSNEGFRETLEAMDIGRDDLQIVWTILDSDRSGTVTSKEFVSQVYKLKASDTQFMLAYIKFYVTEIKDKLREDLNKVQVQLSEDMDKIETNIEDEMEKEFKTMKRGRGAAKAKAMGPPVMGAVFSQLSSAFQCGACGWNNGHNAPFCESCGTRREGMCECGNVFIGDATFCKYCGASRNPDDEDAVKAQPQGEMNGQALLPSGENIAGDLGQILGAGSLKELLENVHFTDLPLDLNPEPAAKAAQSRYAGIAANDHSEMLAQLENVWQQCIVSIDDMRNFHMSLANLLESMIRRVSITIHHTVSASVTTSTSKLPSLIRSATQLSSAAESSQSLLVQREVTTVAV